MFYGLNRFSEDLDFTYINETRRSVTIGLFEKVLSRISAVYELGKIKRRGTYTSLDMELHIKGPLYARRKTEQSLEINLSMREKLLIGYDPIELSPVYPDIPTFIVPVMKPEEILAEKVRALLTRKNVKSRDIYDIYYLLKHKHVMVDKNLITKKLETHEMSFSKTELQKRLNSVDNQLWLSEMSNLIAAVPKFSQVIRLVREALL